MNVLAITARADHGGGPEHIRTLIGAAPRDVRFAVACPRDKPYWERYGDQVGRENLIEIPHRAISGKALLRLSVEVRSRGILIIHSHGKGAGLYSRALRILTGRPCVHTWHGLHAGEYSRVSRMAYLMLERGLSCFASATIAVSAGEAAQLRSAGLGSRLRVIPNGVAIPAHRPAAPAASPHRVVMMTRYDYQKHAELVIEIAEALRGRGALASFRFDLLGMGPRAAAVSAALRTHELGDAVRIIGAVDDPKAHLRGAFAYLSTSRWEGMPLAVLEAMAHGVPVIATDVVGNRDAVEHGRTGFLYDPAHPAAAADSLLALASDRELWTRASAASRTTAQECYSADRMSAETVACYRALLTQDAARATDSLIDWGGT
jgi:glycosyltransferase involved in cell wall biosynthesis